MVAVPVQNGKSSGAMPLGDQRRYMPSSDGRCRYRVRVWLDVAKAAEYAIMEQLEQLKRNRLMTSTIRDALTLLFSLQRQDISILERLFPFVADHYKVKYSTSIQQQLDALRAEVAALQAAPGPPPLSVPQPPAPVQEDDSDLLRIKKAESAGAESCRNFLDSAFSLIQ